MERDEALHSQDNIKLIITKRMSETGITAYKISKATGISQGQLSEWFNGKTNITLYKFLQIIDVLGLKPELVFK